MAFTGDTLGIVAWLALRWTTRIHLARSARHIRHGQETALALGWALWPVASVRSGVRFAHAQLVLLTAVELFRPEFFTPLELFRLEFFMPAILLGLRAPRCQAGQQKQNMSESGPACFHWKFSAKAPIRRAYSSNTEFKSRIAAAFAQGRKVCNTM